MMNPLTNVVCYIDGFNLYHGLRSRGWKKYYWLDLWALAEQFLKPGQVLREVVYCTSKIKNDPPAMRRQQTFLEALQAHRKGIAILYGHFLAKPVECFSCKATYTRHEEKKTDVNIACRLLTDAMDSRFDVALLVSADSDLVPPVEIVKSRWPQKKVIAIFPPDRKSDALKRACDGQKWISEAHVRQCQLPATIPVFAGKTASRPIEWV